MDHEREAHFPVSVSGLTNTIRANLKDTAAEEVSRPPLAHHVCLPTLTVSGHADWILNHIFRLL